MIRSSTRLLSHIYRQRNNKMCASTTTDNKSKLVSSKINYDNGVAVLALNRKPVNSLTKPTVTALQQAIQSLERDHRCKGFILTSTLPGIFSAGVDLTEFLDDFPRRFRDYWSLFQDAFLALYTTRLATVAAINGHALAGGCVLAMACDYRIMSSGVYHIGSNESKLDMFLPFWICDIFSDIIGQRQAERHLQCGTLFKPDEALSLGLVDDLCDQNVLLKKATSELEKMLQIQDDTRTSLKKYYNAALHSSMLNRKDEDIEFMVDNVSREACQKTLQRILKELGAKKLKKMGDKKLKK